MKAQTPNDRLPLAIPPRDRFVRAIAERLAPDRITEVHLFQPIRQGGVETGVAVIAAERPLESVASSPGEATSVENPSDAADFLVDGHSPVVETLDDALSLADNFGDLDADGAHVPRSSRVERHSVFTARYRLTLKGADRGKWEFHLEDEAVAPLATIVAVARGVGERAGDAEDPERWTGEHFRTALSEAAAG